MEGIIAQDERFIHIETGAIGIYPACNRGLKGGAGSIYMTMDDDVELVDENTLQSIVQRFEEDERLGVLQLSEYYPDGRGQDAAIERGAPQSWIEVWKNTTSYPAGNINRWGFIGTKLYHLPFGRDHEVYHVRSSCMAIRRDAFLQVGGFYEPYVVNGRGYRCETDLCVGINHANYKVVYAARTPQVLHKTAPKTRGWTRGKIDGAYLYATSRNNMFFFLRNYWSRASSIIFFIWDVLVGGSQQPGLYRLWRYGPRNRDALSASLRGKVDGFFLFWRLGPRR